MEDRIAVTGAQGFAGRHLVVQLLDRLPGAQVLGIGRSPDDRDHFGHSVHCGETAVRAPLWPAARATLSGDRYRYRQLDVLDRPAMTRLLGDFAPSCVIHLAAALRDQPLDQLLASNVGAAASLLEALVGAGLEACPVVLGSTGGVYGAAAASELPLREELRGAPADFYSLSKQAGEDATRILAGQHGLHVVWARMFNLVGPGQEERHFFGRVASQLAAIRAGLRPPELELGALDPTRDFVDVRDAAEALWLLARRGAAGQAYNVASGRETRIGDALALLIDVAELTGRVEVRSVGRRATEVPRHVGDISRLRGLGFEPRIGLRQSARDVVDYYAGAVVGARARPVRPSPRLTVAAAERIQYTVEVATGLLERLPERLRADFPGRRMAILTDTRVWELHGRDLLERMRGAGLVVDAVRLPEGERSKTPERYLELVGQLHATHFDRRALLINLGGGLVTDVGGFVAATYMRGIDYVNVPTTLLAQHDSAIGGKVAVNAGWGTKNFLGAFHHPRAVYCDPGALRTLSARDLSSGVAEAIKIALCGEPELWHLLEERVADVRARDAEVLGQIVRLAAAGKAALLAPDPYEVDLRRVLNLGHTLGHAIEAELGGDQILHGEAVAFGIAVATVIGLERGLCPRVDAGRILALLDAYDLPPPVPRGCLAGALRRLDDIRLVRGNRLHFVIPTGVHGVRIVPEVADAELERALERLAGDPGRTWIVH
ncbi:MAG TPA: iron-containing alcohol dehydrogenase [Kofleriaceae bacterium]|nr:iron-containing alcohol dehydrogenase [Kofleriaceae bacterium]